MQSPSTLKRVKYSAITISALMVAGIVALMVLSRGKGEDITGIVAPALLITIVSGFVAIVAAILQKRVKKPSTQKKKGFCENKNIIRNLTDAGVVHPWLRADA